MVITSEDFVMTKDGKLKAIPIAQQRQIFLFIDTQNIAFVEGNLIIRGKQLNGDDPKRKKCIG